MWVLGKEPCAVSAGRQRGPGPQGGGAGWDLACQRRLQACEETSCRRLCRPHRGASPSALVGSEERRSGVTVQPVSTPAALRV